MVDPSVVDAEMQRDGIISLSRCLCCPGLCLKQFSGGADKVLSSREFQNFITLSEKKMLA